jgi:hypothetical protein
MNPRFTRRHLLAATACGTAALAGCTTNQDPTSDPNTPEPTPTPDDQQVEELVSFDVAGGECGGVNGDMATATVEGDLVTIAGAVPTPTPCHTLTLGYTEPSVGNPPQALLTVERTDEDACIQCTGVVTYELIFRYVEDEMIENFVVTHARTGSNTEFDLTL